MLILLLIFIWRIGERVYMKTKEFIKRVEELGYDVNLRNNYIQIIRYEFVAVVVYIDVMYSIAFHQIIKTSWNNGDKLFDLIVEYAKTPVEDREEDTKDKLLNEINRILNYVKDFDNKGLMEVLNGIEKLEDDLEIFANDLKCGLVEVEE